MPTVTDLRPTDFPWFRYENYTFSLGLTDGVTAWLSGHSASEHDPESRRMVVRGGMHEQVRTAYAKIATILQAGGLTWSDVTKVVENVTVTGMPDYPVAAAARAEVFGTHEPAVATVVVDALLRPAALIEIEVLAVRGGGTPAGSADAGWHRSRLRTVADGEVQLPTILPVDGTGSVVHEGDLAGQYAWCLERADELLGAVGLDLGHAVTTYDYTTPATRGDYRRIHPVRRDRLGGRGVYPGAGGILMSTLHAPGVLVALDVTANSQPLTAVNPGWSRYDTLSYTPGVRAGRTLYMSGFAALDMETQEVLHPGDVVAQAEATYDAVLATVAAAGGGPEHLVSTIEFVTPAGLAAYRGVAGVRERRLRAPWPASTGAICAGLLRDDFLLEVFPMAVLDR